jgi:hypothetical protein
VVLRLLLLDQHLQGVAPSQVGQPLNLNQSLPGATVTVEWAYADAERILVGYSVVGDNGRRFDPGEAALTLADGTVLKSYGGYGVTGQSDILGVDLPPGEGSFMHTFANPDLGAGPLKLRLTLYLSEFNMLPTRSTEAGTPDASGQAVVSVTAMAVAVAPGEVVGPYTFDFSVPVQPTR